MLFLQSPEGRVDGLSALRVDRFGALMPSFVERSQRLLNVLMRVDPGRGQNVAQGGVRVLNTGRGHKRSLARDRVGALLVDQLDAVYRAAGVRSELGVFTHPAGEPLALPSQAFSTAGEVRPDSGGYEGAHETDCRANHPGKGGRIGDGNCRTHEGHRRRTCGMTP